MHFATLLTVACNSTPAGNSGVAAVLARSDLNRDGALSVKEYASIDSAAGFLELDADRDGAVRLDELDAWLHLAEPRPEGQVPSPGALMAALDSAALPAVTATANAVIQGRTLSRGKPPRPDPSVVLLGGMALAWVMALWATVKSQSGAAS